MSKRKLWIAIVAGIGVCPFAVLVGYVSMLVGYVSMSVLLAVGFCALAGFVVGILDLPARGFFGGLLGVPVCLSIFCLAGDAQDRLTTMFAMQALAACTFGASFLFFIVGHAVDARDHSV